MPKFMIKSLPDELVIEILRHVDGIRRMDLRLDSLASLSLCSKRLHLLVEPFLYSTYRQTELDHLALPLFVRTILVRPELPGLVKGFNGFVSGKLAMDGHMIDSEDRTRLKRAVLKTFYRPVQLNEEVDRDEAMYRSVQVNEEVYRGDTVPEHDIDIDMWLTHESLGAVLMSLLPNLESIGLAGVNEGVQYRHVQAVFERARKLQDADSQASEFALAKVKKVWITPGPRRWGSGLDQLLPFLALPSVAEVQCLKVKPPNYEDRMEMYFQEWPGLLGSGASTITSMAFEKANLESDCILPFVSLFPNLKRFSYDSLLLFGEFPPFNDVLNSYCLEELSLTQNNINRIEFEEALVGPLSRFQKLRIIQASAHILIGLPEVALEAAAFHSDEDDEEQDLSYPDQIISSFIESMPSCLEDLTLKDCNEAIFGLMSSWLAAPLPPKLRTIAIVFDKSDVERRNIEEGEDFLWKRLWLDRLASEQGVEVDWIF